MQSTNDTKKKQLIIIGCGPGGYATASYAAAKGFAVTIFEKGEVGGTCLNRGCIPTKVYCHVASVLLEQQKLQEQGILGMSDNGFSFAAAHEHKEAVVAQLRQGIDTLMAAPGISLVRGEAQIKDQHTVTCDGTDYHADYIIIATGSHPTAPPVEGIDSECVVDSTALLDVAELPKRLAIIGAGVIGMEMASAFAAFGTEVTVVEFLKECLPMADADLAKRLRKTLEKRGVTFYLQAAAQSVSGNTLTFVQKGKTLTVDADLILCATGRGPNIAGIGLENAGIEFDRKGIKTNDTLETSVEGVYAIGDCNGRLQLAHAAEAQGRVVINHLLAKDGQTVSSPDLGLTPWAVFTTPELAGVGPTDTQLKAEGKEFATRKSFYRANGKAVAMDATDGLVKTLSSPDGKLIACHALGAHAADIVQEVTALINAGATTEQLETVIHIHPTLQELL